MDLVQLRGPGHWDRMMALWLGVYPFAYAVWFAAETDAFGACCTMWIDLVLLTAADRLMRASSAWSPMALLVIAIKIGLAATLLDGDKHDPVRWGLFVGSVAIGVALAMHTFHPIVLWRHGCITTEQLYERIGEHRMDRILRSIA